MLILPTPLVAAIVGLLLFVLGKDPKLVRIGEMLLFWGLFFLIAAAASLSGHPIRFG